MAFLNQFQSHTLKTLGGTLGLFIGSQLIGLSAHATYANIDECLAAAAKTKEPTREASICRQIYNNNAWRIEDRSNNARRESQDNSIKIDSTELNSEMNIQELSKKAKSLGVEFLFAALPSQMSTSDLSDLGINKVQWFDLVNGTKAISNNNGKVNVTSCPSLSKSKNQGTPDLEMNLNRASRTQTFGSYFIVDRKESIRASIQNSDSFTVGAWVKVKMADLEKRELSEGYHPVISMGNNYQWQLKVTGDTAYLLINRNNYTENINFDLRTANWGDTFGSCFSKDTHRECWHYIAFVYDSAKRQRTVFTLRGNYDMGRSRTSYSSYVNTDIISAQNVQHQIANTQEPLLIGGGSGRTFDGSLQGVLFAKKALKIEDLNGLALATAPASYGRPCDSDERVNLNLGTSK